MDHRSEVLAILRAHTKRVKYPVGDNVSAACPFHRKADGSYERHPSFTINVNNGLWQCWACGARGNLRTFLREVGVPRELIERQYAPLLEDLRARAPAEFDPTRPNVFADEPVDESVLGLFDRCPLPLLEDGFDEELLRRYDVGFDEKHMRITFPMRDLAGTLLGISGRGVLHWQERYKVYDKEYTDFGLPAREQVKKGRVLWNAHNVYPVQFRAREPRPTIVVEGFKACLRMIQHGFLDTVALLGSSLSDQQLWILERMGGPVYLMLDNNEAGFKGTLRAAARTSPSLPTFIVEYETEQPDQLTREGAEAAVAAATDWFRVALETGVRSCRSAKTPRT